MFFFFFFYYIFIIKKKKNKNIFFFGVGVFVCSVLVVLCLVFCGVVFVGCFGLASFFFLLLAVCFLVGGCSFWARGG